MLWHSITTIFSVRDVSDGSSDSILATRSSIVLLQQKDTSSNVIV